MSKLKTSFITLCALLLLAPVAFAQEARSSETEFGDEVEVSEVLLDVIVTNKDGQVIVGLGPEDFRVTEDGEAVELQSVRFYSSSVPQEAAAEMEGVDPVPEDRYFIFFVDDQRKNQASVGVNLVQRQMQAGRDAAEWAERNLAPADWVAVVGYDRSLKVYTDFTRDQGLIAKAVKDATAGRQGMGNWPSRQKDEGPSLLDDLPQGKALTKATTRVYSALTEVAKAAGDITGRKNLIYLGLGFGRLNRFGAYDEDERYYPDMIHAINDNNVAVYPLDVSPSGASHPFESALTNLAEDTGGRYFPFFSSFNTPLAEITQETNGYYLLSYRASHPAGEEGFQRVKVEATNGEFKVRARRGYEF